MTGWLIVQNEPPKMRQPLTQLLEKTLYTTSPPDSNVHLCVVVFNEKHAVTFNHAPHSLQKGQFVHIWNVIDSSLIEKCHVKAISTSHDFVILEICTGTFKFYPNSLSDMYSGMQYLQLTVNAQRKPSWKGGVVAEKRMGFYYGSSNGRYGDSGAGIFSEEGQFIGMSNGLKAFNFSDHTLSIHDIALHHPDTQLISSDAIFVLCNVIGEEYTTPAKVAKREE